VSTRLHIQRDWRVSLLQVGTLLTASTSSGDCVQFISDADGAVRLSLDLEDDSVEMGPGTHEMVHFSVNSPRWVAEVEVDALELAPVTELRLRLRPALPALQNPWRRFGLDTLRPATTLAPLVTAVSLMIPIIASYAEFSSDSIPTHGSSHITVSSKHELEDGIRRAMVCRTLAVSVPRSETERC
jgi:hypothetical protein